MTFIVIKKIILCAMLALVVSVISIYVTQNEMQSTKSSSRSSMILYDVYHLTNVLNYLSKQDLSAGSLESRKIIESLVIVKISVIAGLNPEIERFHGVSLKALKQVIKYMKHPGFSRPFANDTTGIALSYMESIEGKVMEQSKRPRNILKESERERLGLPMRQ